MTGTNVVFDAKDAKYPELLENATTSCSDVRVFRDKFGDPCVIENGFSGWYLVWEKPRLLLNVKKNRRDAHVRFRIPRYFWQRVDSDPAPGDIPCIVSETGNGVRRKVSLDGATASTYLAYLENRANVSSRRREVPRDMLDLKSVDSSKEAKPVYNVEKLSRVSGDDFAYQFVVRLNDVSAGSLKGIRLIKRELCDFIAEDYVSAYGGNVREVQVDFPEFSMNDSVIEGRAEVMRIAVKSLRYDAQAQKGVIAVKIGANRFEDARKWVRKNIESLAKDKNIALTTGQIPPAARFYLGAERVLEGNVLEIEFETE